MLDLIDILNSGTELNDAQLEFAAGQLLDENEDIAIKTQFLKSLAKKGETPSEIAGFVKNFLKHAVDPKFSSVDCCFSYTNTHTQICISVCHIQVLVVLPR